jgi:class 3 adenylate cyclase
MEQNRLTERLLSNVLPQGVVDRLKMLNVERNQDVVIADRYACATILFADIVGFTQYARTVSAVELVNTLGALFTVFDNLCVKHGVTKVGHSIIITYFHYTYSCSTYCLNDFDDCRSRLLAMDTCASAGSPSQTTNTPSMLRIWHWK